MNQEFKIGDKVIHKTTEAFEMIIIDFEKRWENNIAKQTFTPNPKYPICRYYNSRTNKWEKETFNDFELELLEE
ncbi:MULTISPECIES: hypothetical protein [unclassified Empedobacter]|uniref:hypothetical protein n=1 Tax=unclassified Empedobacter TaxID=2643773 RepID=UPI0025BECCE8|nr:MULTISPECIES: hypothetical protein [unclassified Empedobacter]